MYKRQAQAEEKDAYRFLIAKLRRRRQRSQEDELADEDFIAESISEQLEREEATSLEQQVEDWVDVVRRELEERSFTSPKARLEWLEAHLAGEEAEFAEVQTREADAHPLEAGALHANTLQKEGDVLLFRRILARWSAANPTQTGDDARTVLEEALHKAGAEQTVFPSPVLCACNVQVRRPGTCGTCGVVTPADGLERHFEGGWHAGPRAECQLSLIHI